MPFHIIVSMIIILALFSINERTVSNRLSISSVLINASRGSFVSFSHSKRISFCFSSSHSLPLSRSIYLSLSLSLWISRHAHNTVPRLSFVCFRYLYICIYKNTKNNLQNDIISYITREFFRYQYFVGAPYKSLGKFQETPHRRFVTLFKQNIM